jgi:hypothetical protein
LDAPPSPATLHQLRGSGLAPAFPNGLRQALFHAPLKPAALKGVIMTNERERSRAEIEARLTQLGETINTLRVKAEEQKDKFDMPFGKSLDEIESKREEVRQNLEQIETLEDEQHASTIDKLGRYLEDIDDSLRKALSYFS